VDIKQKVADLDKKFEGLASVMEAIFLSLKNNPPFEKIKLKNKIFIFEASYCENYFSFLLGKPNTAEIRLCYENIDLCIDKAHDYFITKGGNL
jgi:hypothetical protein